MAFFSIIIPTYQASHTLRRCLESILEQTDTDVEVVIQDGGSTDETLSIAQKFDDSRIRIFSEPDRGIYDAMNKAIERSTGTWLLFLGCDDYLYEATVLAKARHELTDTAAQLVYGNVKIDGDTPWAAAGTVYRGETSVTELFSHNYSHQAIFYHRSIFDKGHRYNIRYRVCADYDFNLFCTAKYHVQYLPLIISFFVGGGISSVTEDPDFAQNKWMNIVRYFGSKLLKPCFAPFRRNVKKAGTALLKRGKLTHAWTAYGVYLKHKFVHRRP